MSNANQIRCCLKIGKYEYMERLYRVGEIYMQSIEYYKKHEHPDIGDRSEGMDKVINKHNLIKLTLQIPKLNFEYEIKTATYITYGVSKPHMHLFCLTGITQGYLLANVNPKNEVHLEPRDFGDFGDSVCIIKDVPKFHSRFEQACEKADYKLLGADMVEYYNETEYADVNLSPFHKRDIYKHQEEFRYVVESEDEKPICLTIGSLEDIADLYTMDGKHIL